jgi:hypothetical protein
MKRYRWTLFKSMQFLNSRRPDLDLRPNFLQQLTGLEARLAKNGIGPKSGNWEEVSDPNDVDELIMTNTYKNSQIGAMSDYSA